MVDVLDVVVVDVENEVLVVVAVVVVVIAGVVVDDVVVVVLVDPAGSKMFIRDHKAVLSEALALVGVACRDLNPATTHTTALNAIMNGRGVLHRR